MELGVGVRVGLRVRVRVRVWVGVGVGVRVGARVGVAAGVRLRVRNRAGLQLCRADELQRRLVELRWQRLGGGLAAAQLPA